MRARFLTILAVFGAAGLVMTSIAVVAAPRLSASSGKAHVMTELIARAGDAQLTPLADGRVSVDERIEAAENTAQCLRDAGILVEMTPARGSGTFRFGGARTRSSNAPTPSTMTVTADSSERSTWFTHSSNLP